MLKFLLWCLLLVICWPVAILAILLWPLVWLILLPFRLIGWWWAIYRSSRSSPTCCASGKSKR